MGELLSSIVQETQLQQSRQAFYRRAESLIPPERPKPKNRFLDFLYGHRQNEAFALADFTQDDVDVRVTIHRDDRNHIFIEANGRKFDIWPSGHSLHTQGDEQAQKIGQFAELFDELTERAVQFHRVY